MSEELSTLERCNMILNTLAKVEPASEAQRPILIGAIAFHLNSVTNTTDEKVEAVVEAAKHAVFSMRTSGLWNLQFTDQMQSCVAELDRKLKALETT